MISGDHPESHEFVQHHTYTVVCIEAKRTRVLLLLEPGVVLLLSRLLPNLVCMLVDLKLTLACIVQGNSFKGQRCLVCLSLML